MSEMCCFRRWAFTASTLVEVKRDNGNSAGLEKAPEAICKAELPVLLLIKEAAQKPTGGSLQQSSLTGN